MMNPVYFAFGSNMNAAQMRHRCPRAYAEASAVLLGHRLAFSGCYGENDGAGAVFETLGLPGLAFMAPQVCVGNHEAAFRFR